MPSGEEEIRGLSITFTKTTRHHSGVYTCSADNGFGRPTNATIVLDVQRKFELIKYWKRIAIFKNYLDSYGGDSYVEKITTVEKSILFKLMFFNFVKKIRLFSNIV